MYKIIGADNREYGPISAEQVREWMRQGRVNLNTLVQAEGKTEWQRLGSVPEFATPTGAPPLLTHDAEISNLASKKIAAGICGILIGTLGVHKFILGYNRAGIIMLLVTLVTCGFGGIAMWVIGLIEGIIYLCKSDRDFVETYVLSKREWF